jgi:glutamyl-tRNA reductase
MDMTNISASSRFQYIILRSNKMNFPQFYIAGINYKKTNASLRGLFAIDHPAYATILKNAAHEGIQEIFILSTCNRTEIYGIASDAEALIELLCSQSKADIKTFREICYIKQGFEAVQHLFLVAAGLDSQILGDYEIVAQLKQAVKFSKQHKRVGTFLERLANFALQASKTIKSQTRLSSGSLSVAFAAMQFIKENALDIQHKKILLIGTGKIGKNTCKNLVDYLQTTNITLVNRTDEKAECLAWE